MGVQAGGPNFHSSRRLVGRRMGNTCTKISETKISDVVFSYMVNFFMWVFVYVILFYCVSLSFHVFFCYAK